MHFYVYFCLHFTSVFFSFFSCHKVWFLVLILAAEALGVTFPWRLCMVPAFGSRISWIYDWAHFNTPSWFQLALVPGAMSMPRRWQVFVNFSICGCFKNILSVFLYRHEQVRANSLSELFPNCCTLSTLSLVWCVIPAQACMKHISSTRDVRLPVFEAIAPAVLLPGAFLLGSAPVLLRSPVSRHEVIWSVCAVNQQMATSTMQDYLGNLGP